MKLSNLFKSKEAGIEQIKNCSVRLTPERIKVYERILILSEVTPVFRAQDLVYACANVTSAATVYNAVGFFKRIGILTDEFAESGMSSKMLDQILQENVNEIKSLEKYDNSAYAIVKAKHLGRIYTAKELDALIPALNSDIVIVKIHKLVSQNDLAAYGVITNKNSKLYKKKCKLGMMNADGMVRCTLENSRSFDYVHKSFIKML